MTENRADNPRWRFSFWPVLAFICVLPALLALGVWQVQRGTEKSAAFAEFERAASGDARDVTALSIDELDAMPRYEHVRMRGRYLAGRQFLLDNMPRHGRPGHHVLTAFKPDGAAHLVMVDRGWRPGRAADAGAAGIAPDAGVVTIRGLLAPLPRPALQLEGGNDAEAWPRVVQFPDANELAAALDGPVATPRLLLDADMPQGFERDWSAPGIPPARHYAYAFQWFALAVALIVIFVLMARPRRSEESEQ